MERFSDDLRNEREARHISLEAIGEITKVSQRHLLALETGQYASLPGGIFRKGILRGYLSALGLDAADWIPRFEQCLADLDGNSVPPADVARFAETVQRSRAPAISPEATRWPGVIALILLLLVFGWFVWHVALRGRINLSLRSSPSSAIAQRTASRVAAGVLAA